MRLVMVSARRGRSLRSLVQLKMFVLWLHCISACLQPLSHCIRNHEENATKRMLENMLFLAKCSQLCLGQPTRFFPYWTLIALLGWNETWRIGSSSRDLSTWPNNLDFFAVIRLAKKFKFPLVALILAKDFCTSLQDYSVGIWHIYESSRNSEDSSQALYLEGINFL